MWSKAKVNGKWQVYDPQGRLVFTGGKRAAQNRVRKGQTVHKADVKLRRTHVVGRKMCKTLFPQGKKVVPLEVLPMTQESAAKWDAAFKKMEKLLPEQK